MGIWNHVRIGARMLRKSPGFAATAILTMALGIGATTAIFSVADAMLWKPLPIPRLDSLVMVMERRADDPHDFGGVSPADFADIHRQAGSLQSLAAWTDGMANIVGAGGEPERVIQYLVSANFFDVIGIRMPLGRGFQAGEDEPGREREVVLSDTLWRSRFGGDRAIVGRTIRLDDEDFLVTGVAPPKFTFPKAAELWTPLAATPAARNSRRASQWLTAGRLKPGRTLAELSAELEGIGKRLAEQSRTLWTYFRAAGYPNRPSGA
jgi:putative ABC transport system permease protein